MNQIPSGVARSNISDCLLFAPDDCLSSALALLNELTIGNVICSKSKHLLEKLENTLTKGSWTCNSDHFHEKVVERSKEYAHMAHSERLLRVIGDLQKLMRIRPRDLHTSHDLSDVADDIGLSAVNVLKQMDSKFCGSDVGAMIEYVMTKIFGGLNIRMEELSAGQQQTLVDRVREFVQSLPREQQRFIIDKLGASGLSDRVIHNAIANGALWTAFAAAVQLFGFTFYTTAAHLLAIVSLHLLPFGAYVGVSSTIAVLSSPWMLPIFACLGTWYYARKNRELRQTMAPLIVTSLYLSGMEVQARDPTQFADEALRLWAAARNVRNQRRAVTKEARRLLIESEQRLATTRRQLSSTRTNRDRAIAHRNDFDAELKRSVLDAVNAIASGAWGQSLVGSATKLRYIERTIAKERRERHSQGVWEKARHHVEYVVRIMRLNTDHRSAAAELIQQVKSSWPHEGRCYSPIVQPILRGMENDNSEILAAEGEIQCLMKLANDQSVQVDAALSALAQAEEAQRTSEDRYHGLDVV
jgi:hypothetical protein